MKDRRPVCRQKQQQRKEKGASRSQATGERQMPYHYNPNQLRVPAGRHDGGQWTSGGGEPEEKVQPIFLGPAIRVGVPLGIMLYKYFSALNNNDRQAIIIFKARRYGEHGSGSGEPGLDTDHAEVLDRKDVEGACPKLDKVQEMTDKAATKILRKGLNMTPAEYGTAVHSELKQKFDGLNNPDFKAEVSYLKSKLENYGTKDSIRVDIFENPGNGTVCVYDIKTGQRGLSSAEWPRSPEMSSAPTRESATL
jgi:hypothetical protein